MQSPSLESAACQSAWEERKAAKILNSGYEFIGIQDFEAVAESSPPKVPEMQLVQLADARRLRCQLAHFDERQSGGTSHGP